MRPRLLDLFCGAGGCSAGYVRAGFDVTGVDHRPMPRYLLSGATAFHQADALEFLAEHGAEYDAIHASPPCQKYSPLAAVCKHIEFPDFLPQTKRALYALGKPFVIENVIGAPLHGIVLCGAMFGLRTYRHRRFECSWFVWQPPHPKHKVLTNRKRDRRKKHWDEGGFVSVVGDIGTYVGPEAMGIDWMNGNELSQAIPPAYTEFIGRQLLDALEARRC